MSGRTIERLENALSLGLWYARSTVCDRDQELAGPVLFNRRESDGYLDGRGTVSNRIFEEIAHEAPQKSAGSLQDEGFRFALDEQCRVNACGLLCGKPEHIDMVTLDCRTGMFQTAGKQDLFNELIEFCDIPNDVPAQVVVRGDLIDLDRHSKAGEW